MNWDLFAVGLTAFFLYAWARRAPVLAGVLLGLAVAAKFYPLFLVGPLIVLALRTGRWRAAGITVGTGAATWVVVNAPGVHLGPRRLGPVLAAELRARRSTGARSGTSAPTCPTRPAPAAASSRSLRSGRTSRC